MNAINGTVAGNSLAILGGVAGNAGQNNGQSITFSIDTTGFQDLIFKYATQRSGTGFTSQTLAYSTGAGFTQFGQVTSIPLAFGLQTFDLSSIDAIENNSNFMIRITFAGSTAQAGNNRFDNVTLDGNALASPPAAVPLPPAVLAGTALLGVVGLLKRRRAAVG